MIIGFEFLYGEIINFLKHTEDQSLKQHENGIVELLNLRKQ